MRRPKKRVKWWLIVLAVIVLLAGSNIGGNYIISESNYEKNVAIAANFNVGVFDAQGYLPNINLLSSFNYSLKHDVNTYSHIAATYNALNYLKRNNLYAGNVDRTIIPKIIKYYDLYAQLGFGYFGVNPMAINWYFNSIGLKANITFDRENIAENLSNNDICILFRSGETPQGVKEVEYRAVRRSSETTGNYIGPNASFNINNRINIDYKNYFLALIVIKAN